MDEDDLSSQSRSWVTIIVAVTVVLGTVVIYYLYYPPHQQRAKHEAPTASDLRELRAKRLEELANRATSARTNNSNSRTTGAQNEDDQGSNHQEQFGHSVVDIRGSETASNPKSKQESSSRPSKSTSTANSSSEPPFPNQEDPQEIGPVPLAKTIVPQRGEEIRESPSFDRPTRHVAPRAEFTTTTSSEYASSSSQRNIASTIAVLDGSSFEDNKFDVHDTASSNMPPSSKRQKAQRRPIQELCQELSEALAARVQPTSCPESSEWNGTEGWTICRMGTNASNLTSLELPFAAMARHIGDETDPWERLHLSLVAMRKADPNVIVPRAMAMSWITSAFGRLRTPGRPELARCTKFVQEWIVSLGAAALEGEMLDQSDQADDDYVPGLFADEIVTTTSKGNGPTGLQDQLIALLENLSVSVVFLDALFEASSQSEVLAGQLWERVMDRIDPSALVGTSTHDTLSQSLQRLSAINHLVQSKFIQKHIATEFTKDLDGTTTGRDVENAHSLKQLFRLAAYTVPETIEGLDKESFMARHLADCLSADAATMPAEVAVFSRKGAKGYEQFQRQSRQLMESARSVCRTVVGKTMTASRGANKEKRALSLPLTKLLAAELLSSGGVAAISSTWPFLNGLSSCVINLCVDHLRTEFDKQGPAAFDPRFLLCDDFRSICADFKSLVQNHDGVEAPILPDTVSFAGTTKFFFVGSSLLHSSLYPMMRVERSFQTRYNKPLLQLQAMANDAQAAGDVSVGSASRVALRGWTGWTTFLDDPALVGDTVNFALIQLQWLLELLQANSPLLNNVPDWMCKEPARWLTHVAGGRSGGRSLFIPHQAALTIETATRLLAAGSNTGGNEHSSKAQFSPVVLTELIHIVSAFIRSGVRKAAKRGNDNNDVDDRSMYISLDKNNLSTYVYTNEIVTKQLCPVLMNTFQVLDHVEGLNVDAEASFDKYSAKSEISRLLLILWGNPYDDRCRKSMLTMPEADVSKFIASVALVAGFLFDDGHQRFVDVCKSLKKQRLTAQEQHFMEGQKERSTNALASSRGFLVLLWKLSLDPEMAAIMGGTKEAAKDLAAMITHVLELTVHTDGGLHGEIDTVSLTQRSSEILKRVESDGVEASALRSIISTLVSHRRSVKKDYGLDASVLVYSLLAIATRCYKEGLRAFLTSPLVESLAGQDDCDVDVLRLLVTRHVPGGAKMDSVEENVLLRDGYVGEDVWMPETTSNAVSPGGHEKHRHSIAAKDHIPVGEIQSHVQRESILEFLDAVDVAKQALDANAGLSAFDPKAALTELLAAPVLSQDIEYTDSLSEWVVSSHPFASSSMQSSLSHAFGHSAKGHATIAPGKVLNKEARKCHKNIPKPHPNSAVFVCFAEERMDICRCLITGPVDTPYAFGAFEFDVFFPPSYPNIPPLVQFMTTGGGRVRFGPNLYLDGKVCLSLLGTFNAQDQSQQWNPTESSLPQVLLSIQTQLLTEDPYFNEPGHESMRRTGAGLEASRSYNLKRSLDTLRYAVIEPLKNPSIGLEEIIYRHFAICRLQVLAQARRWALEAKGTDLAKKFDDVFDRLVAALNGISNDMKSKYPPLAPRREDIQYLRTKGDPLFAHLYKPETPAIALRSLPQNPWASGIPQSGSFGVGPGDAEIEDFYT